MVAKYAKARSEGKSQAVAYQEVKPEVSESSARQLGSRLEKRQHVRDKIDEFGEQAASNMIELANNARSEKVRLDANKDLLDRAGFNQPKGNVNLNLTSEDFAR